MDENSGTFSLFWAPFTVLLIVPFFIRAVRRKPTEKAQKGLQAVIFAIGLAGLIFFTAREGNKSWGFDWLGTVVLAVEHYVSKAWLYTGYMLIAGCILSLGSPWLAWLVVDLNDNKAENDDD